MSIQPVIVIYNVHCNESLSLQMLLKQGSKPLVVDNSTLDLKNEDYCFENGLHYISMNGNAGLSKAYNRAIDALSDEVEYILWLDDDTELPENYIQELEKIVKSNLDYKVFVPIVKTNKVSKGLLSPSLLVGAHTYRLKKLSDIDGKRFSAINSGMMVAKDVYNNYRYDEKIFLDCLDHDFMIHCWNCGIPIYVMHDIVLKQNFSSDQRGSRKNRISRFRIFSKDFRVFREKNGCSKLTTEIILCKRLINVIR